MLEVRVTSSQNPAMPLKKAARALIIHKGKIAVMYSKKYDFFMMPGGGAKSDETLQETCIREALEETGFKVEPFKQIALLDADYEKIRIQHHYFLCHLLKKSTQTKWTKNEIDQDLELRWMSLEDLKRAFSNVHPVLKYDMWMQREGIVINELRHYLK